ncbi:MAG: T9SS type A sorting domain-containing protein [Phycisphaerae bacterium]|nr:T9SS type A sorting domain-containing protein [Saprospiraceae bacterium]
MQIKVFSLFAFLAVASLLRANNTPVVQETNFHAFACSGCEIPPPDNFHVEEIGSTWVNLAWDAGDLLKHRVRIYRSSDNFLLNTTIVPGGITNVVIAIPVSTECYAKINTICEDDSNSTLEAQCPPFMAVILELVVNGYNPTANSPYCTISSSGGTCNFPSAAVYPFWVKKDGVGLRRFGVELTFVNNPPQAPQILYIMHLRNDNTGETFKFYCDSNGEPTTDGCGALTITINRATAGGESEIAVIEVYQGTSTNVLRCSTIVSGYKIQYLGAESLPGGDRNNISPTETQPPTVSPNPFSDLLDVFPGNPSAENIHLQMYNLSGQKVLDQQFAGGQEQYSLSTAGLSAGFYLLRVEADGEVQTLKVVKSE